MKASHRHFLDTPFHGGLQEVKGKVDGFTERMGETTTNECSYANGKSRGYLPVVKPK